MILHYWAERRDELRPAALAAVDAMIQPAGLDRRRMFVMVQNHAVNRGKPGRAESQTASHIVIASP